MSKSTRNVGRPWIKRDYDELRRLRRLKTPLRIIALKLGRTESAVQRKAFALGVKLPGGYNQSPYNERNV